MTDIVDRLREWQYQWATAGEAADEIERLRAALAAESADDFLDRAAKRSGALVARGLSPARVERIMALADRYADAHDEWDHLRDAARAALLAELGNGK